MGWPYEIHSFDIAYIPQWNQHKPDIVIIVLSLQKVFAIVHIVAYVYLTATFVWNFDFQLKEVFS